MNKLLIGIALGFVIVAAVYFSLTFSSTVALISYDFAVVRIKNESGRHIKTVLLRHDRGVIQAKGLADKDEIQLIFKNRSENSYNIVVTFDDDSFLTSSSEYIEYGYRGVETIRPLEIVTHHN